MFSQVLAALLQYAADPQDKHWLAEQQHMRATGGKMVSTPGLAAPAASGNRAETHRRARMGGGAASQGARSGQRAAGKAALAGG